MYYLVGVLFAISLFHAWRYSKTSVDPDWAYFNLWGFTGAVYGRDFADCKTPLIHLWYLGLSKLVGKDVARVKFANHLLIGCVGIVVFLLSGNFWAALTYTVLVNSGWLLAFHGNVGQLTAAVLMLAFSVPEPMAFWLWVLAVGIEPKLILALLVVYPSHTTLLLLAGMAIYLLFHRQSWFQAVWESSVIIPARMTRNRKGDFYKAWIPWFTANGLLYLLPWLLLAVTARLEFTYWLPALVYMAFLVLGKIVRQNHLLPLIPFIAWSGLEYVWLLVLVDFLSAGLYLGNVWGRFYSALDEMNDEAQKIGAWLKDRPGTVYVNGIHSGIYIHTGRKPLYGFVEQIEIREVAHERRKAMVQNWQAAPPDWVVDGRIQGIRFKPVGYQRLAMIGDNLIYRQAHSHRNATRGARAEVTEHDAHPRAIA